MSANGKSDILTPKQALFFSLWTDPSSETFGNAYQSGVKAGFKEEYAKTITSQMPDWLSENIKRLNMLDKAEKNLNRAMDYEDENPRFAKLRLDASKFVAERLNKKHYSLRKEMTGPEGKDLPPITVIFKK